MNTFILVFAIVGLALKSTRAQEGKLVLVQLIQRHSSKVPDRIIPGTEDFWAPFGNAGLITPLGVIEAQNYGRYLRQKYIFNENLLPAEFNQSLVYVRTSSRNTRPMVTASAAMKTMYPGAHVPIFTVNYDDDEDLLFSIEYYGCPAYGAEIPRIDPEIDQDYEDRYAELIEGCRNRTVGWDYPTGLLMDSVEMNYAGQITHGYPNVDPFFIENEHLLFGLEAERDVRQIASIDNDPRGRVLGKLGRVWIENMEAAIDGTSPVKFYMYSAHGLGPRGALDLLGYLNPTFRIHTMDTVILELRRKENGEYYVNAEIGFRGENHDDGRGISYKTEAIPINCPSSETVCHVDDFLPHIKELSPEDGCCVRGRGFYELCTDYLNPDTLEIEQCYHYRVWCPHVACGDGQVLDSATLLCVETRE